MLAVLGLGPMYKDKMTALAPIGRKYNDSKAHEKDVEGSKADKSRCRPFGSADQEGCRYEGSGSELAATDPKGGNKDFHSCACGFRFPRDLDTNAPK